MNRLENNCHSLLIRATIRLTRDGFSAITFWEIDFSQTSEKQKLKFETLRVFWRLESNIKSKSSNNTYLNIIELLFLI